MKDVAVSPRNFRLIEVGPPVDLSDHRNAVGVLYLALEGDLTVSSCRGGSRTIHRTRSAFVPSTVTRSVLAGDHPFACLFIHPCDRIEDLTRRMVANDDGVFTGHTAQDEIAERLRVAHAACRPGPHLSEVVFEPLGLTAAAPSADRIETVIAEICGDPGAPNRVSALADLTAVSESRLRHQFKAATGLSIKRFRVWARLVAAMEAAEQGESLTSAAYCAGFSSSAHFSAAHRAVFGAAPTQILKAKRRRVRC